MELFTDKPGDDGLPGRERALAMIAVMTSTTMAVFDGSVVNIALPQMAHALTMSAGDAVWIVNGYLLSVAMSLAIFAALAARIGFRRLFTAGVLLFTLASSGCALSISPGMLVAMRALQGIGGAAMLSIAPAILRAIFPHRLLGSILGINALLIATNTAIAPVAGGALLSAVSWPWLFAINIPFGLLALVLAWRVVPDARVAITGRFDVQGAFFSALTLGAVIMASNAFSQPGAEEARALPMAALYGGIAIVSGLAFIRTQRRVIQPLLPLALFASPRFSLAALTSLSSFVSQGITFIALPFLFQRVYGYSTLSSALLFTCWPVGIILVASHAGRFADRYSPAVISTLGLCLFAAGLMSLALLPGHAAAWDISLRGLLCGVGFGCFQSPNNREMLASVSKEHSSYASGVLAIMRTFGQSLGTACVGVILSIYAPSGVIDRQEYALRMGLWIALAAAVCAIVISVNRLKHTRRSSPQAQ